MAARSSASRDARPSPPPRDRLLRVSFSALLRIRDEDRMVLFQTPARPDTFGPPGGVFKYFDPATPALGRLNFRVEQRATAEDTTRSDLRGFLPYSSMKGFQRWFATGAYREDATECLRRELLEELAEVGFPGLAEDARGLAATAGEIAHGRAVKGLIAPQSALLIYSSKLHADIPALL